MYPIVLKTFITLRSYHYYIYAGRFSEDIFSGSKKTTRKRDDNPFTPRPSYIEPSSVLKAPAPIPGLLRTIT